LLELLPWPSRSPDLNIIENCWSMLSEIIYDGRQFDNVKDLWQAIDNAVTHVNVEKMGSPKIIRINSTAFDGVCQGGRWSDPLFKLSA